MKISVDKEKCIGCGSCEVVCPKVFEMKDGKAVVKDADSDETCVNEAKDICPTDAISVS